MTYDELTSSDVWKKTAGKDRADLYQEWVNTYNNGVYHNDITPYSIIRDTKNLPVMMQQEEPLITRLKSEAAAKPKTASSISYGDLSSTDVWKNSSPKEKLDMFLELDGEQDPQVFSKLFSEATTHPYSEDFKEGLKNSVVGLAVSDELPEYTPEDKFTHKLAYGAGNIIGRLPTDVPAALGGFVGGSLIGQPELAVAAPSLVTDNLMTAIRAKKLADQGTPMEGGEIAQELLNNTALGGATMLGGIAGRGAGTVLGGITKSAKAIAPLETAGQFAGMTALPMAQGNDVSANDLLANAALLGISKGTSLAGEKFKTARNNAREAAANTELLTTMAQDRAAEQQAIAQQPVETAPVRPMQADDGLMSDPRYQSALHLSSKIIRTGADKMERQAMKAQILGDLNVKSRKELAPEVLDNTLQYLTDLAQKRGVSVPDLPGAPASMVRFGKMKDKVASVMDSSVGKDIVNSLTQPGERIAWTKVNHKSNDKGVPITNKDVDALMAVNDFFIKDRQSGVRKYMPEKLQHFTHDIVDNFHSYISNAGPEARKVFIDPFRDGYYGWREATEKHFERITKTRDALPKDAARRIGLYLAQQNDKLRAASNVKGEQPIVLTSAEIEAMNNLKMMYAHSLKKINVIRESLGQEPIKPESNYFTAFRKFNEINDAGGDIFTVSNKQLQEMSLSPIKTRQSNKIRFGHEKEKAASRIPIELDAFAVAAKYLSNAERYIHLAPTVDKLSKLANLTGVDGREFNLHPALKEMLNNKLKVVSQGRVRLQDRTADKIVNGLANNTTRGIAAGNVHIVASQSLALVNTELAIGPKYTAMGINSFLKMKADTAGNWVNGKGRYETPEGGSKLAVTLNHPTFQRAMRDSRVLKERFYKLQDEFDLFEESFEKKSKFNQTMDRAADIMSLPTRVLDMDAAYITWEGAKQKYLSELAKEQGMEKGEIQAGSPLYKEACRRADETVVRTQAGVNIIDKAEIQHSTVGRVLSAFCNFGINNWNFMRRNLLGLGENKYKNISPAYKVLLMSEFLALTGAINSLYSLMDEETPFPDLVGTSKDGDPTTPDFWRNIFVETSSLHPLLASAKFGQSVMGPVGATLEKVRDAGVNGNNIGGGITAAATLLGVPGSNQAYKTLKGTMEYGNPLWRSLLSSGYNYAKGNEEK